MKSKRTKQSEGKPVNFLTIRQGGKTWCLSLHLSADGVKSMNDKRARTLQDKLLNILNDAINQK